MKIVKTFTSLMLVASCTASPSRWLQETALVTKNPNSAEDSVPRRLQVKLQSAKVDKAKEALVERCSKPKNAPKHSNKTLGGLIDVIDPYYEKQITKKDMYASWKIMMRELSRQEMQHTKENMFYAMCTISATHDQECFKWGTDSRGRTFDNLWDIADTNEDFQLSMEEFSSFFSMVDLDKNDDTNWLEAIAWFTRNEYIVCRPIRSMILHNIEKEEKQQIAWFTEQASSKIKKIDANKDGSITKKEFKKEMESLFANSCNDVANNNYVAFLMGTEPPKKVEKKEEKTPPNFFELLEKKNLTTSDLADFEKSIGLDKGGAVVKDWLYANMKYICKDSRESIIENKKKAKAEDALQTKAVKNFKKFLDVDFNHKVDEEDNEMFQESAKDRRNFKNEVNGILYNLAYENALADPKYWLNKTLGANNTHGYYDVLNISKDSTPRTTFATLFKQLDGDNDQEVTNEEMLIWFNQHEKTIVGPYRAGIEKALSQLDKSTLTSYEVELNRTKYYVSGLDQLLSWEDAELNCIEQGGHLLSLEYKEEFDLLKTVLNFDPGSYWIGLFENSTWTDKTESKYRPVNNNQTAVGPGKNCTALKGDAMVQNFRCKGKQQFICKRPPPEEKGGVPLGAIIGAVVGVLVVAGIIIFLVGKKKKQEPVHSKPDPKTGTGNVTGGHTPMATVESGADVSGNFDESEVRKDSSKQ